MESIPANLALYTTFLCLKRNTGHTAGQTDVGLLQCLMPNRVGHNYWPTVLLVNGL